MKQKPTFTTAPLTPPFKVEPAVIEAIAAEPIEAGDAVDLFAEPTPLTEDEKAELKAAIENIHNNPQAVVLPSPVIVRIEPAYVPTDSDVTIALLALLVGSQHNVSPATAIEMAKELVRQQHES